MACHHRPKRGNCSGDQQTSFEIVVETSSVRLAPNKRPMMIPRCAHVGPGRLPRRLPVLMPDRQEIDHEHACLIRETPGQRSLGLSLWSGTARPVQNRRFRDLHLLITRVHLSELTQNGHDIDDQYKRAIDEARSPLVHQTLRRKFPFCPQV